MFNFLLSMKCVAFNVRALLFRSDNIYFSIEPNNSFHSIVLFIISNEYGCVIILFTRQRVACMMRWFGLANKQIMRATLQWNSYSFVLNGVMRTKTGQFQRNTTKIFQNLSESSKIFLFLSVSFIFWTNRWIISFLLEW